MKHSVNKNQIILICEAGRLAILAEETRRWENDMTPLSDFYRTVIYQKYRDIAVDMYPSSMWEEIGELYDQLYKKNEENHRLDSVMYS